MNVIYKSTGNWNPGDDLSYLGTRKVLFKHLGIHNEFFYDANPEMNELIVKRLFKGRRRPVDTDVWHPNRNIHIDLIVIAGTPVWRGHESIMLRDYALEHKTPIIYIGVGTTSGDRSKVGSKILWAYCKGFIARDRAALQVSRNANYKSGKIICCPSIFALDVLSQLGTKTGIVFQRDNRIDAQYDLINKKMKTDDVLLITHEIQDYEILANHFPQYNDKIVYSRNLDMLVRFYVMCKKVYSMRLHGTHLAFALGIPTLCMKVRHSKSRACDEIKVKIKEPEDIDDSYLINREKISEVKKEKWQEYDNYLSKCKLCEK